MLTQFAALLSSLGVFSNSDNVSLLLDGHAEVAYGSLTLPELGSLTPAAKKKFFDGCGQSAYSGVQGVAAREPIEGLDR